MNVRNAVWIPPSATTFSCLCESCLDVARGDGSAFLAAVRAANVRGRLPADTDLGFVHCRAGHQIVVRRVPSPPLLARRDPRQLELV